MKIIKPKVEILEQKGYSLKDIYSHITRCGKVCYASEFIDDVEKNNSFVSNLIAKGHTSVLEHGTVVLVLDYDKSPNPRIKSLNDFIVNDFIERYDSNYSDIYLDKKLYIITNYRVIVEEGWFDDLEYLATDDLMNNFRSIDNLHERITVKFTIDRALAQEFTRHRQFSFSMQSQRYCNYSKDKFDNQITFVLPTYLSQVCDKIPDDYDELADKFYLDHRFDIFTAQCKSAEKAYFDLLEQDCKPEEARVVLPNCTKTELIMTGTRRQWEDFFDLRLRGLYGKPHPDAVSIAQELHNLMNK